jgi:hypothetical protein
MKTTDVPPAVTAVKYWFAFNVNTSTDPATIEMVAPFGVAFAIEVAAAALDPNPR